MGDELEPVQKALRKALNSNRANVSIWLTAEESQEVWEFFESKRIKDASPISEGTESDLRNMASGSAETGKVD